MEQYFVGIDVAKDRLDIHTLPDERKWAIGNNETEILKLIEDLKSFSPVLIVLEATGGLEILATSLLGAANLPVAVVNPRHVKDFSRATGKLAKTDPISAKSLALFAEKIRPEPRPLKDKDLQELTDLVTRRKQLVTMLAAEKNRLSSARASIRKDIQDHIAWLEKRIKESNGTLEEFIRKTPLWREKDAIIQSMPGLGPVFSVNVISGLPELGTVNNKQIGALVGVAPLNCDSGKFRGKRIVWGGRAGVRTALYMATLAAIRFNPVIKAFHERLIKNGKKPKVAITACMRKLITILNTMIKNSTPWSPKFASSA